MYVHPSFEDKLRSVELYESGLGSDSVGKALNIPGNQIRYWIRAYKQFGTEGLRKQRYHQPSRIFKCEVVK